MVGRLPIGLMPFFAVASACSDQASKLDPAMLNGTYDSSPCPDISIEGQTLIAGNEAIPFKLITIKGDEIMAAGRTVTFNDDSTCELSITDSPRYISIHFTSDNPTFDIFSDDFRRLRTYQMR